MMGELMLLPLPLAEMNRMLFRVRSKPQLLLLSRALDSLRFCAGDRIAYMSLSWKDFQDCGALPEHAEAIVILPWTCTACGWHSWPGKRTWGM